jgi:hypothetical protein
MAAAASPSHQPGCGCGCGRAGAVTTSTRPRLVAYSLVCDEHRRSEHARQFELSVSSLRASNARMPVVLFAHGALAPEIAELCSRHGVMVSCQGPYRDRLAALLPHRGDAMARYPVLHKSLNFVELAGAGVEQVLCCDLDTVFFSDVEHVFERYGGSDVIAREEVYSSRSMHGADRAFIDEPLLARLAAHLGRAFIAPINLGVVLYNHGVVARLASIMPTFLDDTWRLMTGLTMPGYPHSAAARQPSLPWLAEVASRATDDDRQRALPFPSNNGWIVEEIAWWLALGSIPGLRLADFSAHDVAQNGEVLSTPRHQAPWALCHYYSQNFDRIVEWLRHSPSHAAHGPAYLTLNRRTAQPAATFER